MFATFKKKSLLYFNSYKSNTALPNINHGVKIIINKNSISVVVALYSLSRIENTYHPGVKYKQIKAKIIYMIQWFLLKYSSTINCHQF